MLSRLIYRRKSVDRRTGVRSVVAAVVLALLTIGYLGTQYLYRSHQESPPWIYGKRDSRFSIILYADLKCPYCRDYLPVLIDWIDAHHDVKLQWHHRPLEAHEPSASAEAVRTECAGRVGGGEEFWRAVTRSYSNAAYAPPTSAAFDKCVSDGAAAAWVNAQAADATANGISATPTLILVDAETGETLKLEGPVPGDLLLSALDLLVSPGEFSAQRTQDENHETRTPARISEKEL